MCGIAGLLDRRAGHSAAALQDLATSMADAIRHRGPDDSGTWVDSEVGLALGFRRLAILDLTPAGAQPMVSVDGRYVLIFNGEIYNHGALRAELADVTYRGHSDTEVMLAAFVRWGIPAATRRFNGMFAFAVWDRQRRVLTLARDRMGEKPLYYGTVGGRFLFGSELKALRATPGFRADLDRDALTLFLRHGYLPAPHTVYQGIAKLLPAHLLEVTADGIGTATPYWSARDAAIEGQRDLFPGSEGDAVAALHPLLRDAVGMRMEADVPLGAFLSGGIDSSLVVALMQEQSSDPVRTFTIGFTERGWDEAPYAKAVAAHLGTAHTELYVTPAQAREVVPLLPSMYDEPFADSSQIPTHLVSRLARSEVTVSLSGDGGDELFGGYDRYSLLRQVWSRLARVPLPLRRGAARAMLAVPPRRWDAVLRPAGPALPAQLRSAHPGDRLHKLAGAFRHGRPEDLYLQMVSLWDDPASVVLGGREPATPLTTAGAGIDAEPALRAMQLDAVTYLPDDILAKVDRAAMAVSLETRVPLLDHRVYELAWRMPTPYRMRAGAGKQLLRRILHTYVPSGLVERPKMGFGIPVGDWLRGDLRPWAEDLLSEQRLRDQGLLDPAPVRAAWQRHVTGQSDEKYKLWAVLMLQAWLDEQPAGHCG
ncbi:MAG TPA: asparagine synthase (glutamine-hydrolyzing) [Mycobacteriales bacterium]|nr:asparagine synthase (glutamine-hydrolyzing) [Mycobacteriales bacterium]